MRIYLSLLGILLFVPFFQSADAAVINYWDYWQNRSGQVESPRTITQTRTPIQRLSTSTTTSTSASRWQQYLASRRARSGTSTNRTSTTTQRTTSLPVRNTTSRSTSGSTSRWQQYLASRRGNTTRTTTSGFTTQSLGSGVRASATPIALRQQINDITAAPVDLFRIGFSHNTFGSDFVEAVNIDGVSFQIIDNTGSVNDFTDFSLTTSDGSYDFDSRGFVTVDVDDLRVARSESRALDFGIEIDDPDSFPRFPGSFRVKLQEVTAYKESSLSPVNVTLSGRTISDHIVFNPRPSVSAGASSIASVTNSQTIVGRPLGGGETAIVLTMNLSAGFDDFLLEELTVTNQFGSNADRLISRARLVDLESGQVIDTTGFVGGRANFDIPNSRQYIIPRTQRAKLGIELEVNANPEVDNLDNRLRLLVTASDIELFGLGAGRDITDAQKNVSLDSETFTISNATLTANGGISFSAEQPPFFPTGDLRQVARFKIANGGSRELSFGRFSLQITPSGVTFANGGTVADVQLVELFNGVTQLPSFTTTSMSGGIATFDANSEVFLQGGQTREFALLAALDNVGSNEDSDGVALVILGDNSVVRSTLGGVRASGARFIWSDHSGSPHTTTSNDWLSGFQFPGVPTNAFVNTRR